MPTPYNQWLILNGLPRRVSGPDDTERLLFALREQCNQRGPKFGCGVSQCGACTVILNGEVTRSCVTRMNEVPGLAQVRTLDGIGGPLNPHPMQQAFIDEQAGQCAFCINGMVMGSVGWIEKRVAAGNHNVPSKEEIAAHLSGEGPDSDGNYICRCGTHRRIVDAIQAGAEEMT
jgi:aerobic-type carbon monoxide dehydrogenase small subunit (CoxS/CutS family)